MSKKYKPTLLVILDGFGYSEHTEGNAIAAAKTPTWDALWQNHPHTLISGSGHDVGLPDGQMGNSEVGHLNLGAGRRLPTDLVRINDDIASGEFANNAVINAALDAVGENQLHLVGLLSTGGVHSHQEHIFALIRHAAQKGICKLVLHLILDGRDTAPKSAQSSIEHCQQLLDDLGVGQIATVSGRYFAMDRDQRWDRTQKAYDAMTQAIAEHHAASALDALQQAYQRGETDEFVSPTIVSTANPMTINDDDVVVFMNFRSDRARQLTQALTLQSFTGFERVKWPRIATFVTLTQYAADLPVKVAYKKLMVSDGLAETVSKAGLTQLHAAETEKYAHVTFFFNGGREEPFPGEDRCLIPSPNVATYDLQPEMSAEQLTDQLVVAITEQQYDMIVCNYANPDMVGHTGNFAAAVQAIEVVDHCLQRLLTALDAVGGQLLLTADHGNVECMINPKTEQPHTAHTTNLVPLVYYGREATFIGGEHGTLIDVVPTLLTTIGLPQPLVMTGRNLLRFK